MMSGIGIGGISIVTGIGLYFVSRGRLSHLRNAGLVTVTPGADCTNGAGFVQPTPSVKTTPERMDLVRCAWNRSRTWATRRDNAVMTNSLIEEQTTESIIGAFYEVYRILGSGLLEKAYTGALDYELELRGHAVRREIPTDICYKGRVVARYRTDMVVDDKVVLEVKSTSRLAPEDHRQVINFLRATRWEVGLLLHFGPKAQFHRFVSSNADPLKYGGLRAPDRQG